MEGIKMEQNLRELNITELRLKKRPLWMSDLGIDDYADMLGGGGDIYKDCLPPAYPRFEGMELSQEEEKEIGPVDIESFREKTTVEAKTSEAAARVSGFAQTVRKTAEAATETISGVIDSLKNIFKGQEKKEN